MMSLIRLEGVDVLARWSGLRPARWMLSRLPAVSGELITRDCLTMHGGHGCARPAPDSPRCQAGTANRGDFWRFPIWRALVSLWWLWGYFDLKLPLKRAESFDKGNSAERQKWNVFFHPVSLLLSCEIVQISPHATPITVAAQMLYYEREFIVAKNPAPAGEAEEHMHTEVRTKASHGEAQCPACTSRERAFEAAYDKNDCINTMKSLKYHVHV